jgi:tetratricopeptide (TPR) repeat protein
MMVQGEDVPGLLQQAAESVFEATQPYRFSMYQMNTGHADLALQVARRLAEEGPISERAWAWIQISNVLDNTGDALGAAQAGETAAKLDPSLGLALINESGAWALLGRTELVLKEARKGIALLHSEGPGLDPVGRQWLIDSNQGDVDDILGDRRSSAQAVTRQARNTSFETFGPILQTVLAYELALNHDVSGSLQAYAGRPMADVDAPGQLGAWGDVPLSQYERAVALDDWSGALTDVQGSVAAAPRWPAMAVYAVPRYLNPRLAMALAHAGRFAEAEAIAESLPADCYRCLVARGDVEALAGHSDAAARWFAEALRQGPSIPMAETQWGAMLLAKGDVDGAMAKFALALAKGPHYADPREMWGEALMRKGDFAGAAVKFAAADKDAPRWGRNHLRWGQALARQGKTDEAKAQWRAAAGMDLSAADRAELVRMQVHG